MVVIFMYIFLISVLAISQSEAEASFALDLITTRTNLIGYMRQRATLYWLHNP